MAYTVNWITKVISIPTTDLTLVSGFRYSLNMFDFLTEIRRLEWQFDEGLWALPILIHDNTRFDFVGTDYAPFDEILNGYTVIFTGVALRVDLIGSNNNIVDVLIPSGISVVPSNSAGLIVTDGGGGGLTPGQEVILENIEENVDWLFKSDNADEVKSSDGTITKYEEGTNIVHGNPKEFTQNCDTGEASLIKKP